ncbi:MAG: c-type cytochrome [Roseibacillus sp.]
MKQILILLGASALGTALTTCTPPDETTVKSPVDAGTKQVASDTENRVNFTKSIKPILANKCTICHNAETLPNRPNFETGEQALQSGMIVPGKPSLSRLLTVIQEDPAADKAMPPVSHRLTPQEIELLKTWIAEGAVWPSGDAGKVIPAFIPKE